MENQYYTPERSEFFEGFECEVPSFDNPEEWSKTTFVDRDHPEAFGHFQYMIPEENRRRVKFLDQEDIESLGFKLIEDERFPDHLRFGSESSTYTEKEGEMIDKGHSFISIWITKLISFKDRPVIRIKTGDSPNPSIGMTYFFGNCKNKSKLKMILEDCRLISKIDFKPDGII